MDDSISLMHRVFCWTENEEMAWLIQVADQSLVVISMGVHDLASALVLRWQTDTEWNLKYKVRQSVIDSAMSSQKLFNSCYEKLFPNIIPSHLHSFALVLWSAMQRGHIWQAARTRVD